MADDDELLDLFDAAVALPPAERPAFLDARCAGRPGLRAEIDSLLAHAERSADFLERPPDLVRALASAATPRRIGPYRLTEKLGEGSFGEVWRAEQTEPIVRSVAVKVIRPGVGSAQTLARFTSERQALALLEHPGIARIHDAGTTEDGQPWYAMELVDGPPLTEYARRHRLGLADRIRLTIQVCDALQHAHARGIVHRDLKPSNVLVHDTGDRAQPKIIDFGIAKLQESDLAWRTQQGQVVGTPAYMSPEQARGDADAVDARTDVHAVGLLLFELLTGTLPFEPSSGDAAGLLALHRRICEQDAPRPSLRIDERSRAPGYRPPVLARAVRGDLDWIVLKTLAKARDARYPSAAALAEDLESFLRDRPVAATPQHRLYRLRKWVQRHRAVAAAGGLALLLGTVGAIGTLSNLARAEKSERTVQAEAQKLAEVGAFLRSMLASADPEQALGRDLTVRELLETAERQLGDGLSADVEAALRFTLGMSFRGLGRQHEAERNLRRALELADRTEAPERGEVRRELALVFAAAGRMTEAKALVDEALSLAGEDLAQQVLARDARGVLNVQRADFAAAVADFEAALADVERTTLDPAVATALRLHLADALDGLGRHGDARRTLDEAHAHALAEGERGAPRQLQIDAVRVRMLLRADEGAEAIRLAHDCVRLAERIYGPDHFETGYYRATNAEVLRANRRLIEAEAEFRAAIEILRKVRPEGSITEARTLGNLGWTLSLLERNEEAEPILRESLEIRRRLLGPEHPDVADCLRDLAKALRARGAHVEAEQVCREALAIHRRLQGGRHLNVASSLHALALTLLAQDRAAEAAACLEEGLEIAAPILAPEHSNLIEFRMRLGHVLLQLGRYGEARPLLETCYELTAALRAPDDRRPEICARAMVELARATGDADLLTLWQPRATH